MDRAIYKVDAQIVDSTGAFHIVDGYPKTFDSKNYDNDLDKCYRRAQGEFSDTWGAMCKRDDRKMQTVVLMAADGFVVDRKSVGTISEPDEPVIS